MVAKLQDHPQITPDSTRSQHVNNVRMRPHVYQEFQLRREIHLMFRCGIFFEGFDGNVVVMGGVAVSEDPRFRYCCEVVVYALVLKFCQLRSTGQVATVARVERLKITSVITNILKYTILSTSNICLYKNAFVISL